MPENKTGEFLIKKEVKTDLSINAPIIQRSHAKFFSSLAVRPDNVKFQNQEEDEEVVLLIRRDLITNTPWIVAAIILATIPFIITALSSLFAPFFNISPNTQLILVLFYYLIVFGFILIQFSIWYFTVGLITNKRIVDMDLNGILSKHVSETKINLIEDVSYEQTGSIRTIFDYGDVHIQTAGTFENIEFDRAPEPAKITRIVADMIGGKPQH